MAWPDRAASDWVGCVSESLPASRTPMPEWYDVLPERDTSLSSHWHTEEFPEELRAWCTAVVGPVREMRQQKLRGRATVWRVETDAGVWFAKQNCPGQRVELPTSSRSGDTSRRRGWAPWTRTHR